jgi:uncharacterized membrane protein YeaQ/YmgE (transglycosylase-associated protein family)
LARHGKKKIRFGSGGKKIEDFVDPNKDPHSYLKRFILEENYRDWFNRNYPDSTIYDAVGLNEWEYNAMEKKLSPDQDTIQETAKNEPEPEPELESESKIEAESTDTSEIPPPTPVISEEQQNITKKRTNMLFWMRFAFAIIGGAIATFLFEEIDGNEERRWSSIIFMIVLFIITCFIAKGMKINFPKADRKKLVTTGMGSFIFLYLFAWIMTYTLLNLPRDDFSLPFT